MSLPIRVLGTGGTISCVHDGSGALVPAVSTAELVQLSTSAKKVGGLTPGGVVAEDIMSIDSSSITLEQIDELVGHIQRAQREARGVVVLHGTDTMEETLMAAACLVDPQVPVVFTGAQRPSDDSDPDGPGNIAGALQLVNELPAGSGVHLHFGGRTLPARGVYKFHTTADDAFRSRGTAAHDASGAGLPGWLSGPSVSPSAGGTTPSLAGLAVPIVGTYAADDGGVLGHLLPAIAAGQIDGIVVAALGSGNLPIPVATVLQTILAECPSLPVVLGTRVAAGPVETVYGGAGGGATLAGASGGRLELAGVLSPAQARMALLCRLAVARQENGSTADR